MSGSTNALSAAGRSSVGAIGAYLAVPWSGFVAVFLYYTFLTLIVLGDLDISGVFMIVLYAAPVVVYAALLLLRGGRALASISVDLFQTPHAAVR